MIHWSVSSFYSDIITLQYCTHFTSLLQKAHPYIINPLHTIFFGDSFGCFDCDWCCWNDLIGYQEINRMNQNFQMNPNPFIEWLRRDSGIQPIRIWFIRFNQSAKARPLGLKTELNRSWVNLFIFLLLSAIHRQTYNTDNTRRFFLSLYFTSYRYVKSKFISNLKHTTYGRNQSLLAFLT